jgi:hypothetical protein
MFFQKTEKECIRYLNKFHYEWGIVTDDFLFLKECLMLCLNGKCNKLAFTKWSADRKVWMNAFECRLAAHWFKISGTMPILKEKRDL